MDTFGSRLRSLREARGWSQEKLGFEVEVTGATISKWETGRAEPSLHHLELFLRLFSQDGVTLDWLVAGEGRAGTPAAKAKQRKPADPRNAGNQDELALLARYRQLPVKKQKSLLGLIEE